MNLIDRAGFVLFSCLGVAILLLAVCMSVSTYIDWREHQQYMESTACEVQHD
jgi:hypothetical protein